MYKETRQADPLTVQLIWQINYFHKTLFEKNSCNNLLSFILINFLFYFLKSELPNDPLFKFKLNKKFLDFGELSF